MKTRGEQLTFAIAYALRGLRPKGRAAALSEDERLAIATQVVAKLRAHGDPWRLDEELPRFFHGPSTHGYR